MTENEANIYSIAYRDCKEVADSIDVNEKYGKASTILFYMDEILEALKIASKLQEIGTVEGYERAIQSSVENYNIYRECKAKVQEYESIGTVEELQKSVKEEDILKFYYIESEDKYVVGKRFDTLYYAEVGKTGLCFYMSRYLPWGKDGYPSEPKEITFFDWMQGFMKKEYGGTVEELKDLKEKSVAKKPIRNDLCNCPICETYNEVIGKRRNTVAFDTVYCWHCGQAIEIKRE